MRTRISLPAFHALFVVLLFAATHAMAFAPTGYLQGRVVGVTDGDTITVLDAQNRQHEIRLFGIDAPETSCHQRKESAHADACVERGQPHGKSAKKTLSSLVYGHAVQVALAPGSSYGRSIGVVFRDGFDINRLMLESGYAWLYRDFARKQLTPQEFAIYERAESIARVKRAGLWADANPTAPWDYRRATRH